MSTRSLGLAGATALVVGNMMGVGILLTPRLVAQALPELLPYLGLWLLGGLIALAGSAVYAELGARFPESGGDVVFQEAGLGRAVALGSGVFMFGAAFCASVAAIAVAIGTWQVPTLLGQVVPDESWRASAVGLGVIALLTAVNLVGLRVGALVQLLCTSVPVLGLVILAAISLVTGAGEPVPPEVIAGEGAGGEALVSAFSGVYFAYAGWPAVVYLAGDVRDPARVLPRAMLGGTAMVTAIYILLNLAFAQTLGLGGLADTYEAGTALVQAVLGEEAGWVMAAVVMLALLASINATLLGGAHVAVALARRGGLPPALAHLDGRGVPRRALVVQAVICGVFVVSGSFQSIVQGSVLAMLAIGSLTVLSLVVLRRREGSEPPALAYRASAWPLSPALYLLVSGAVLGVGIVGIFTHGGLEPGGTGAVWLVFLAVLMVWFRSRLRGRQTD